MPGARSWLRVLVATILLMIPCFVAGRPQPFPDTKAYYALGEVIGGAALMPSATLPMRTLRGHELDAAEGARAERLAYTVAAARSPYYSVYLYLLCRLGTAWLVVLVQAFATAVVLLAALRAFDLDDAFLPIVAVLTFTTALPIFTFFVMPDFATALGLLAAIVLAARWPALGRRARLFFAATMLGAALFHTANVLLLLALGLGLAAAGWAMRRTRRGILPAATTIMACAAIGWAGLAAYPRLVRAVRHETIYAPPFVAARLIADGPGRHYLRDACGRGSPSGWCRFARQPLSDNNLILWSRDPRLGAFQLAGYDERVRLIREQPAFVRDVVTAYPGEVLRTAIGNVSALLVNFRVREVLEDNRGMWRDPAFAVFTRIVPGTEACAAGRVSCDPRLESRWVDPLLATVLATAALALALLLWRDARLRARWGGPVLVLAAGLTLNAGICGLISGNAERYQARLLWLVPLFALALAADRLRRAGGRALDQRPGSSPGAA